MLGADRGIRLIWMKNGYSCIFWVLICQCTVIACTLHWPVRMLSLDECLDQLEKQIQNKPMQKELLTLDGQKVNLDEFYRLSLISGPSCALPEKFYHWDNQVKLIKSGTGQGSVLHKIRIYSNYLTICQPDAIDLQKTHGDIAEFYSEDGQFMGIAVYSGNGLYCPLPYSKYRGASRGFFRGIRTESTY